MASNAPAKPSFNDFQYIIAYATIIILVAMFTRTRYGYVTVYYILSMFAVVIILVNAKFITNVLAPLQSGG